MPITYVEAGECAKETSIEVRKLDAAQVELEVTSTCERIQAMVTELGVIKVGHEMSCPLREAQVYVAAEKHVCRNSCIVPAAILKSIEVAMGIFVPAESHIQFLEG